MARKPLAKTVARGYGQEHRRKVKAERPLQVGKPCARCGWPMLAGQRIQLDHDDNDRTHYLGWSHAACNVRASNKRRARLRRARGVTATRRSARVSAELEREITPGVWVLPQTTGSFPATRQPQAPSARARRQHARRW
jgi:hypothetical protein